MSDDSKKVEGFLSRWSRLKTRPATGEWEAGQDRASDRNAVAKSPVTGPASDEQAAAAAPARVELPSLDSLNIDSDYSAFLQPHVEESVRRAGLRKLLRDSHFNVMDGLDVYIEDFGKADPMPAAMLADQVKQLLAAQGRDVLEEDGDAEPAAEGAEATVKVSQAEAPVKVSQNDQPADILDKMSDKRCDSESL